MHWIVKDPRSKLRASRLGTVQSPEREARSERVLIWLRIKGRVKLRLVRQSRRVMFGMMFSRFVRVMFGMQMVCAGDVGMVPGFDVIARFMMLGGFMMVPGGMAVMFSGVFVVFGCFVF
jgi:hypothetical protein